MYKRCVVTHTLYMEIFTVLFFGDVVGKPGRIALQKILPDVRNEFNADLVIANVENLAHGFGITPETIQELRDAGVDLFTSGNHIWDNEKGNQLLAQQPEDIIRPVNCHAALPGRGWLKTEVRGVPVLLINLLGEVFMEEDATSPFNAFDELFKQHGDGAITLVDFHAEATGEKRALGWYADGRASLIVGTHTHVQTADEEILPNGTGYISDLGICGATRSSLGMDKNLVVQKVAKHVELNLEPPKQPEGVMLNGIAVRIDCATRRCESVVRIDRRTSLNYTDSR